MSLSLRVKRLVPQGWRVRMIVSNQCPGILGPQKDDIFIAKTHQ